MIGGGDDWINRYRARCSAASNSASEGSGPASRRLGCCDIHARMLLRGAKVEQRAPTRAVFILLAATRIALLIVSFDLSFD